MELTQDNMEKIDNAFEIKDQFALIIHYKKRYKEKIPEKIVNAYKVQFLEKPKKENLDFTEQWWLKKTKAKINISNVFKEN